MSAKPSNTDASFEQFTLIESLRGEISKLHQTLVEQSFSYEEKEAKLLAELQRERDSCEELRSNLDHLSASHRHLEQINHNLEEKLLQLCNHNEQQLLCAKKLQAGLQRDNAALKEEVVRAREGERRHRDDCAVAVSLLRCRLAGPSDDANQIVVDELYAKVKAMPAGQRRTRVIPRRSSSINDLAALHVWQERVSDCGGGVLSAAESPDSSRTMLMHPIEAVSFHSPLVGRRRKASSSYRGKETEADSWNSVNERTKRLLGHVVSILGKSPTDDDYYQDEGTIAETVLFVCAECSRKNGNSTKFGHFYKRHQSCQVTESDFDRDIHPADEIFEKVAVLEV